MHCAQQTTNQNLSIQQKNHKYQQADMYHMHVYLLTIFVAHYVIFLLVYHIFSIEQK